MPFLGFMAALAPFVCIAIAIVGVSATAVGIAVAPMVASSPVESFAAVAGAATLGLGISRMRK